jgi:eukaryotic-like serine/threonine-protein kinase
MPPQTIGRYDVERMLGQGGMGRVWLARDTVLGRRVAIKVLRDDLALPPRVKDELIARMRHEARAAAAVSHPNIVTLHDMGEDEHVGLYLVFEYVPGRDGVGPESLRDRLRRGALPLHEVARLARELGAAITFAHEAGVVHRDLKPENILFSRTGAKIADFGIARIPESTITRANTVLGTPAYTAPEALGKGDFGAKSDQFSLAATLYEAATAARAFGGEDALDTVGRVTGSPPEPLEASLGASPTVRELGKALLKGLSKEPDGRYATCTELGEAIAQAIEPTPELNMDPLASELIELERTPLSSRMALAGRAARMSERPILTPLGTPYGGDRPSMMARAKTQRVQNVAAGFALFVIVVLILLGRRSRPEEDDLSRPVPSVSAGPSAPAAHAPTPRPRGASHAPPAASPARPTPGDDAGAPRDE